MSICVFTEEITYNDSSKRVNFFRDLKTTFESINRAKVLSSGYNIKSVVFKHDYNRYLNSKNQIYIFRMKLKND